MSTSCIFRLTRLSAAAALAALATVAQAESDFVTAPGGALSATARLDFRITIPKFLYLQVGTGSLMADNGTVDLMNFVVPPDHVGDGLAVPGGAVTAVLRSNGGDVTLSSTTQGAMLNGSGGVISFGTISIGSGLATTPLLLEAPLLTDGATETTLVPATAGIVNRDAIWNFAFMNLDALPAGVYGGPGINNGRVIYTAALP